MKVAQSCLTLYDPMDCPWRFSKQKYWSGLLCSPPGDFLNPGIEPGLPHCRQILYRLSHQGSLRRLEWVAFPFSRGSSQPRDLNPGLPHCRQILYQLSHKGSLRILLGSLSLLQRIFPTQELNRGLLHCRQILYQLSYQGSPNFVYGVFN